MIAVKWVDYFLGDDLFRCLCLSTGSPYGGVSSSPSLTRLSSSSWTSTVGWINHFQTVRRHVSNKRSTPLIFFLCRSEKAGSLFWFPHYNHGDHIWIWGINTYTRLSGNELGGRGSLNQRVTTCQWGKSKQNIFNTTWKSLDPKNIKTIDLIQ